MQRVTSYPVARDLVSMSTHAYGRVCGNCVKTCATHARGISVHMCVGMCVGMRIHMGVDISVFSQEGDANSWLTKRQADCWFASMRAHADTRTCAHMHDEVSSRPRTGQNWFSWKLPGPKVLEPGWVRVSKFWNLGGSGFQSLATQVGPGFGLS